MKALGIFLVFLAVFMSANVFVGLASHDPNLTLEATTFLTPILVFVCGIALIRKSKSTRAKKDGFSL